jgi:hypothetical protein
MQLRVVPYPPRSPKEITMRGLVLLILIVMLAYLLLCVPEQATPDYWDGYRQGRREALRTEGASNRPSGTPAASRPDKSIEWNRGFRQGLRSVP